MRFIDNFLNSITMYRLVLWGLRILAGIAITFGFLGWLPFQGLSMIATLLLLVATCYLVNFLCAKFFRAVTNNESYAITALILFFIVPPVLNMTDVLVTIAAGAIAMISKYILAIHKKHLFNPAAIGVFIPGLFGFAAAIWWVGSLYLLPFVAILGLLVVRKIRRFHLLWSFIIPALVTICLFNIRNGLTIQESLIQVFSSWPLLFFGTIMLTEPLTTPPRRKRYMLYGGFVGVLFGLQFEIGPLFASPEFALVMGNIFSYLVSPKQKLLLRLREKRAMAPGIYEFIFKGTTPFPYQPGQYLEWTLPDKHSDSRGNRRYFTIASSPTESDLRLGVKVVTDKSSSFKKALLDLTPEGTIVGSQLSGDFVLPENRTKKLVFIAGGIGVTPFRSMVKYLLDTKETRDIVFFYACSTPQEFVYGDIFSQAEKDRGVKVVYLITKPENAPKNWKGETGRLTEEVLKKYLLHPTERLYYLSGPNAMVEGYKALLHAMGVKRSAVVSDYFPGF